MPSTLGGSLLAKYFAGVESRGLYNTAAGWDDLKKGCNSKIRNFIHFSDKKKSTFSWAAIFSQLGWILLPCSVLQAQYGSEKICKINSDWNSCSPSHPYSLCQEHKGCCRGQDPGAGAWDGCEEKGETWKGEACLLRNTNTNTIGTWIRGSCLLRITYTNTNRIGELEKERLVCSEILIKIQIHLNRRVIYICFRYANPLWP